MKKKTKVILIILAVLILGGFIAGKIIFDDIEKNLEGLKNITIENIDISTIKNGVYEGKCEAFPVIVKLKVTVSNHHVTNIEIVEHQNGKGQEAETIIEDVIENQTLNVDVVAGATYSSKVILKAIENALTNADK